MNGISVTPSWVAHALFPVIYRKRTVISSAPDINIFNNCE